MRHSLFSALSLRFKLIVAFLAIVAVLTGASFYQIRSVQHFNNSFLRLVDVLFTRVDVLDEIQLISYQVRDQVFTYQQEIFEGKHVDSAQQRTTLNALTSDLKKSTAQYRSLVAANDAGARAVSAASDALIAKSLAVIDATGTSANQQAPESSEDDLIHAQAQLTLQVNKALSSEKKNVSVADGDVDATVTRLQNTIVVLTLISTVLALAMGTFVSSWIARSLSLLKKGAQRVASGDFSRPIDVRSKDEIGQLGIAFNDMAGRLAEAYRRQAFAQQRDEAILQGMGEGLIAIDAKQQVTLMNKAASDLIGLPNETAATGRKIQDIYALYPPDGNTDQPLQPQERPSFIAQNTGKAVNGVFASHQANGQKRLINIAASPIITGGQTVGVITVLRDVTKEREVDRMKTEFISLASHQLRTPLSAIKWFSEMLASGDAGPLQPEQLDFANNIAASTERMIELVNALLNISRIESGRIMIAPKPTDLKELVSGIVNDLRAKIEERQQNLIISVHDDLPKINLDPRLIGQVYLNLLTNAIKYSPKGGEISVFVSRKDDQVISQVTDNGYGIPKAQQDRVFQKFFRAANAVQVETDGTGLGLYLIKTIVESSGGKIWFESAEGKGTTFWFSMPMSGMKSKEGEVTLDV